MSAGAGRLIVFEGGEGSGKSTQLKLLAGWLAERGVPHRCLREPGGTPLGSEVRRLLLDPASDINPRAEALLFMASRAQLVEREIGPALAAGEVVLLDRFFLSTYAYQVGGHRLPEADVRHANHLATEALVPHLTLLLAFPASEGLARAEARATSHDRMEAMGGEFHERVSTAFNSFTSESWQAEHPECGPIVHVDATGTEAQVAERVLAMVQSTWPDTFL